MVHLRALAAGVGVALLTMTQAAAVGPELPLRFDDDPKSPGESWVLTLYVEPKSVSDLRVERRLYHDGELLERYEIEPELQPRRGERNQDARLLEAQLPLRFEGIRGLEPGFYAQKIFVEGRWSESEAQRPIHIERWSHFEVAEDGARPLTLEEYSALTDRVGFELDAAGNRVTTQGGHAREEDVELPKTQSMRAIPLGRIGGLIEEQRERARPEYGDVEQDRSEADESSGLRQAMVHCKVCAGAILFIAIIAGGVVEAAERNVCFRLRLADDRYNCAATSEVGARRGCNNGGYVDAVGHQIELWDKDSDGNDEYIDTWYIAGSSTQCAGFEWENSSYDKGEPNPDVYIRRINIVNRTGYSKYVRVKAVTTGGGDHPATTWRNGQPGDPDRYVARECEAGETCYIFSSGSMVPTSDVASERGLRIMALDSAQQMLQVFGEDMNRHAKLHYPGKASCSTSCADDRDDFHIAGPQGGDGILVGHELGHLIQMQQFGRDGLRNDCSKGGDGWNLTSDEWESCATQEGFASYVGVVSWYEPNNVNTQPFGWSLDFDRAEPFQSTCSANIGRAVQVGKAFWDVDDWNDEAGAGAGASWDYDLAYGTTGLARGWSVFPSGTGNREDNESGNDGVNMRDYYWNNTGRYTSPNFFETFIRHNWLTDQAND